MNRYFKYVSSALLTSLLLSSCGGGSDGDSSNDAGIGYLIDSPIAGLNYSCGNIDSTTGSNGHFDCAEMPAVFKVGAYTVGCLTQITPDTNIYPQDLLGLSRSNVTDPTLIELVQLFQAIDNDGDIDEEIMVTSDMHEKFANVSGHVKRCGTFNPQDPSGPPLDPNDPDYPETTPSDAAGKAGVALPGPQGAMKHLNESMNGETIPDMSDKSKYIGTWIGSGWNWEVRFKRNSGDFASDMFGIDKSNTPFNSEKTIMSLTVEQQNTFTFTVDDDGKIKGEGVIVYNLLPNLCGVHALATQVNTVTNLMSKMPGFFTGGASIYKETIEEFIIDNSNIDKETYDFVKGLYSKKEAPQRGALDPLKDIAKEYVTDLAKEFGQKAVDALKSSNDYGDICLAAAGAAAYGGQSVGPKTLEEMLKNGQLAAAKQLAAGEFSIDLANIVLSIPGYTQVQYYYKGLQNGPETRNFTFTGYINGDGNIMFENVDIDGSPLVVEYTVNWDTDRASFPTWSPFLDAYGTVQAPHEPNVIYTYETVMVEQSYTDVTDGNKTKKVLVPTKKLVATSIDTVASMAVFNEKGTNRVPANSYQWHDYEYNWNAYKIGD